MRKIKAAIAGILALLTASAAVAQVNLSNLPSNTVVGRLGAGVTGPAQAIPFSTLVSQLVGKTQNIATRADIATTTVSSNILMLRTSGYATVGDYGAGEYTRISPSTAAPYRVVSADGQWWALNSRIWTPEMFGCFSGSDCTTAFGFMSTALQSASSGGISNGGIIVNFKPGADYQIWPTSSTPGFAAISLYNLRGVTFNFNGARISTSNTWTHGNANVIAIANSSDLIFNDPYYVATDAGASTIDPAKYGVFFNVVEAAAPWTANVTITNAKQNGGSGFLIVNGVDGSNVSVGKQAGFTVLNADLTNVFYGLSFTGGGDNVFARGIKGTNIGRIYFPSNVTNHDIDVIGSTGGSGFVHALLAVTANPAAAEEKRTLSNIKLRYKALDANTIGAIPVGLAMGQVTPQITVSGAANNGSGLIRLTVNSTATMVTGQTWYVGSVGGVPNATGSWIVTVISGTTVDLQASTFAGTYTSGGYARVPAYMRNIDVRVDLSSNTGQPVAFSTFKTNSDGTPDTTTSGYILANVNLSGSIRGYDYAVPAISMFLNNGQSTGTWVGETVRNIKLSDLIITGTNSSVLIDATNVLDPGLILDNIYCTPTTVPATITGITAATKIRNVSCTGVTDRNTVVSSSGSAGQFATGISNQGVISYATPTGYATVSGTAVGDANYTILSTDRYVYISANFSAARTWTLPAANAVPAGTTIWVQDSRNTLTASNTLTIQRAGSDTINTGGTSIIVNNARGGIALVSDGVSNWGSPVQNVATGGTGLQLGTSGGVPCFTSTTTMASSALLSGSNIMVGGGAGACPFTSSTGGNVLTALSASVNASGGIIAQTPTRAGDIIYWNGSAYTSLAGNNSGTNCLQENSSGVPSWASCGGASGLTVGTTTITSGTSNGALYNNAGVLGNTAAGTNGQLFLGVTGSAPAFASMSQDCTITNAGVITCTGINNVSQTAAWTTFTPAITCGAGALAGYTTQAGRYKLIGKTAVFSMNIVPSGVGTCSGSTTITGLPITTGSNPQIVLARDASGGQILFGQVAAAATSFALTTSGGANPTVNISIVVSGVLETN